MSAAAGSRLAAERVQRGLTQEEMADLTGISLSAYRRLERGASPHDINLRELVNCALVLHVELTTLLEPAWLEWWVFDERRPRPPA